MHYGNPSFFLASFKVDWLADHNHVVPSFKCAWAGYVEVTFVTFIIDTDLIAGCSEWGENPFFLHLSSWQTKGA